MIKAGFNAVIGKERAVEYKEYGQDNQETILLLHGGGLSWWNYRDEAERLEPSYHVILPVIDGHAGSDRHFTTIEENAAEIISFIDESLGGKVLLLGGLSLGAQIALEILSQRRDICRYAFIESAAVIPSKLSRALIGPALRMSYGLIKNKSFAVRQFKALHIREGLFDDYYRDSCEITLEDMVAFMKANASYSLHDGLAETAAEIHIFAGEKENRRITRSTGLIIKKLPNSRLSIIPGAYHGEFSLNRADDYVRELNAVLN